MHTNAGSLFTDLLLEVFRFNGALLAAGDRITADIALTSSRWQVLGTIDNRQLPVPHIAREMGLTRQGVQKTINILFKEGLIELTNNPHHKTAKLVKLSPQGRQRLDAATHIQMSWANDVAENMDEEALESALHVLQSLRLKTEKKPPHG